MRSPVYVMQLDCANAMKRNPTLIEKQLLSRLGMNPGEWLVRKDAPEGLHIQNKHTGTKKIIPKGLI